MRVKDILITLWAIVSGVLLFIVIGFLIGYIFIKGYEVINFQFIFDTPKGDILGREGGIAPAIIGSFLSTGIATIISGVLAIGTAIYTNFYEKRVKIVESINFVIKCIGGIPSIVLGLFGYTMFTYYLGLGRSVIAGSLTLAIMIFPVIELRVDKLFKEVDKNIVYSSYSLGVSKSYTILKVVLSLCKDGILSVLSLGYAYAIGATAPIMFCMAVINSPISLDITKPTMTLSYHLYILITQGISEKMAYGTAFILLLLIVIVILFSKFITRRKG